MELNLAFAGRLKASLKTEDEIVRRWPRKLLFL